MYDNPYDKTKPLGGLDISAFRDSMNRFRTESMFKEKSRNPEKYDAYFTLRDNDFEGYISMKRLYLDIGDPTEFKTGEHILGDYKHWQALCSLKWFVDNYLSEWRLELEARIESDLIAQLMQTARDSGSGSRVTAARQLLDKPWRTKESLRGRPSKKELEGNIKRAARDIAEIDDDYERVMKLVNK